MTKIILFLTIFIPLLLIGCDGGYYDGYYDPEDDYEYEELTGSHTYSDLVQAYEDGWNVACENVFYDYDELYNGDESIRYIDFAYTYIGEPDIKPSYPDTEFPYEEDDLDEAWEQGYDNALDEIFWYNDIYYWGTESYSKDDF